MTETTLGNLAKFLRSKNAGPFKLTIDVFFHNVEDYERVKSSRVLTQELVARLYSLKNKEDASVFEFDQASAIKITFPRAIPSGNVGDTDIYGAQQHGPLNEVIIP